MMPPVPSLRSRCPAASRGSRFPPEALGVVIPSSVGEHDARGQHTPRSVNVSVGRKPGTYLSRRGWPQTQFLGQVLGKRRGLAAPTCANLGAAVAVHSGVIVGSSHECYTVPTVL